MEDRITTGLYLELGDVDPDRYATARAPSSSPGRGVERVTWWAEQRPGPDRAAHGRRRRHAARGGRGGRLLRRPRSRCRAPRPVISGASPARAKASSPGPPTTGLLVVWISPQSPEHDQARARLGRLRPHPAHRGGRHPRVHPRHAVREHRATATRATCTSTSSTPTTPRPRIMGMARHMAQVLRRIAHRGVRRLGRLEGGAAARSSTATPSVSSERRRDVGDSAPGRSAERRCPSSSSTSRART